MITGRAEQLIQKLPERYQRTARQFIKFGLTGSLGAVIDYSSYITITRGFDWKEIYSIFGYKIIGANVASVLLAMSTMFFINKYWTFRNTSEKVLQQGTRYFALNFITFVLNQILTSFFAFHIPIISLLFGPQKDLVAKALAIGSILFINFFGSKFIVFRKKTQPLVSQT